MSHIHLIHMYICETLSNNIRCMWECQKKWHKFKTTLEAKWGRNSRKLERSVKELHGDMSGLLKYEQDLGSREKGRGWHTEDEQTGQVPGIYTPTEWYHFSPYLPVLELTFPPSLFLTIFSLLNSAPEQAAS